MDARRSFVRADAACHCPALRYAGWRRLRAAVASGLRPHRHRDWEICLITRGDAAWWAGDGVYRVPAGSWYLTRPDELHGGVLDVQHPCELWWMQIDAAAVPLPWSEEPLPARLGRLPRVLPCGDAQPFRDLIAALRRPGPLPTIAVGAALLRVLARLLADGADAHPPEPPPPRLAQAMDWARERLRDGGLPAVRAFARAAGLAPSRFHAVFVRSIGETPARWLADERLALARNRLAAGQAVTRIAADLGFASSQHLATAFRRRTGLTPTAWAAAARGGPHPP